MVRVVRVTSTETAGTKFNALISHFLQLQAVIGHGIVGKDIPIMARLAKARRWSK